jgi:hypothetical protein
MDPVHSKPSAASVAMISSALPGTSRGRIEIFDSQQPVAADAACIEVTGSRCDERAEVQRPGGEGAKRPQYLAVSIARPELSIAIVSIAVLLFPTFAALLRLDAQGRNRTRFESLDADLFAGLDAVTVGAVLDALDRFVDLANQLALAIARAQLEAELRLLRGAIVRVRESSPLRPSCDARCGRPRS